MRPTLPGRLPQSRADLEPLLRLALIPLAAAIIGIAGGLVYSLAQSTLYESRSQLVVSPASGFLDPARSDSFPAISTTVQDVALTQQVLADAAGRLGQAGVPNRTTDWLRGHLRLSISGDTPLLTIAGVDGSQKVASAIATAEAEALVKAITDASATPATPATPATTGSPAASGASNAVPTGLRLQVFSKGEPRGKVQPETGRNVLLGGSAGLIVGCFVLAQLLSREPRRRSA
jgi:capsular polysaccharide biosynthesis protein